MNKVQSSHKLTAKFNLCSFAISQPPLWKTKNRISINRNRRVNRSICLFAIICSTCEKIQSTIGWIHGKKRLSFSTYWMLELKTGPMFLSIHHRTSARKRESVLIQGSVIWCLFVWLPGLWKLVIGGVDLPRPPRAHTRASAPPKKTFKLQSFFNGLSDAFLSRFWCQFPSQLTSPYPSKSKNTRFKYGFPPKFHPQILINRVHAAARARVIPNHLSRSTLMWLHSFSKSISKRATFDRLLDRCYTNAGFV